VIQPDFKQQWSDSSRPFERSNYRFEAHLSPIRQNEDSNGGLVYGCPLNNLAQEMSPLDEKFRQSLEKIYVAWRETMAAAFARGIKVGKVREDVSPRKVAAFIVAAQAGMAGTAKNTQNEELLLQTSQALFDYLDSLKP